MNKILSIADKRVKSLEYKLTQSKIQHTLTINLIARDNSLFYKLETVVPTNIIINFN